MDNFDQHHQTARTCHIHDELSFAIDEECPKCIHDEDDEEIIPYTQRIEFLELQIRKHKQDYECLFIGSKNL